MQRVAYTRDMDPFVLLYIFRLSFSKPRIINLSLTLDSLNIVHFPFIVNFGKMELIYGSSVSAC